MCNATTIRSIRNSSADWAVPCRAFAPSNHELYGTFQLGCVMRRVCSMVQTFSTTLYTISCNILPQEPT